MNAPTRPAADGAHRLHRQVAELGDASGPHAEAVQLLETRPCGARVHPARNQPLGVSRVVLRLACTQSTQRPPVVLVGHARAVIGRAPAAERWRSSVLARATLRL